MKDEIAIEPKQVTEHIMLGTDGKYHWYYELNLLKNPIIILLIWKIFFFISLGISAMLMLVELFQGHTDPEMFLNILKTCGVVLVIFTGLAILGYFVYGCLMGWKYCVLFDMDEKGVTHTQLPKQYDKARAMSMVEFAAGMLAHNPTLAGAGLLSASKQSSSSSWDVVRNIKVYRRLGVIKVNSLFNHNQVYAEKEDFEFVENFIKSHLPENCKIR